MQDYHDGRLQWILLDYDTEFRLASYPRALFPGEEKHVRLHFKRQRAVENLPAAYQVLWKNFDEEKWYTIDNPIPRHQHLAEYLKELLNTPDEHTWDLDGPDPDPCQHGDKSVMVCVDEENMAQDVSPGKLQQPPSCNQNKSPNLTCRRKLTWIARASNID